MQTANQGFSVLLLERGSPVGNLKVVASIDGIGRAINADIVVSGLDEFANFHGDAVGVDGSGGVGPVIVGERRSLED